MIKHKGAFIKGLLLAVTFFIVLAAMFMPLFDGKNALEAADNLFNSISKGSTDYIPGLIKRNQEFMGTQVDLNLKFKDQALVQNAQKLVTSTGAKVTQDGTQLNVTGDLGKILSVILNDSLAMFHNKDSELESRHGMPGRQALRVWWNILKEADKDLKRKNKFKEAAFVDTVTKRGVEVAYNFFQIAPQTASSRMGILTFALIFYVIYTLWWGIAVMYLFDGFGLEMKAGAKKEV